MQHSVDIAVTPVDVTGIPTNPMHERLCAIANEEDRRELERLHDAHRDAERTVIVSMHAGMEGPNLDAKKAAARDAFRAHNRAIWAMVDKYPAAEPKRSREEIDIKPKRLGSMPIIMANSVNLGLRAVLAGARYGTTGTIMQDRDIKSMDRKLSYYANALKNADAIARTHCFVTPDHTVDEWWELIQKYEDDLAIVVEGSRDDVSRDRPFIGIVGPDEIKKAKGRGSTMIRDIMKPRGDMVTAKPGITPREAVELMDKAGVSFLPIVDGDRVKGVTSKVSSGFQLQYPAHMNEEHRGGLAYLVGLRHDWKNMGKIEEWIGKKMVGKGFKVDRAHLDRGTDPFKFVAEVRRLIEQLDPTLELHVGNVATGDGALRAADAGATGIWIGIGPSPVCITRVVTNYGVPQITAVEDVTNRLTNHGFDDVLRCADGGVLDTPAHAVAALRSGATHVVGSTNFSKTRESSPKIKPFDSFDDDQKKKRTIWVSGNASDIVQFDAKIHPGANDHEMFRATQGPRKEGDTYEVAMDRSYETIRGALLHLTNGITSGVSFAGGDTVEELQKYGMAMRQTDAGQREGKSRLS